MNTSWARRECKSKQDMHKTRKTHWINQQEGIEFDAFPSILSGSPNPKALSQRIRSCRALPSLARVAWPRQQLSASLYMHSYSRTTQLKMTTWLAPLHCVDRKNRLGPL